MENNVLPIKIQTVHKELQRLNLELAKILNDKLDAHKLTVDKKLEIFDQSLMKTVKRESNVHLVTIMERIQDLTQKIASYQSATTQSVFKLQTEFRDKVAHIDRLLKEIEFRYHKNTR